jgi:hypothetical protein
MATQLATVKKLPVAVSINPVPALPVWAVRLHDAVSVNEQLDSSGKWVDALVLREDQMPTAEQRLALEDHKRELASLLELTPDNDDGCAKRTFGLIAKLVLAKPSQAGGAETVEARMETYHVALDDVPTWAVAVAIRKWHRGQCDQLFPRNGSSVEQHDYRWAPESAALRKIALRETNLVTEQISKIDRLLEAVPFRDCTAVLKRNQAAIVAVLARAVPAEATIDEAAEIGRRLIEARAGKRGVKAANIQAAPENV